jgi:localization factor PodJL
MAAARGNPAAQVEVASRYAKGSGVTQNLKKALEWFGRAAAQGHAPAQYRLAALHERGKGVKKDIGMAQTWYRRAAELGNVRAMHNLAVLYTRPGGKGPDYVIAKNWFYRGASYGLADSQFNLGILYERGLGAPKNIAEAYKWFTLAARQGDNGAQKRRELIRPRLSANALSAVEQILKSWKATPVKQAANRTGQPKGGWQNARTENQSAGSDPALIARAQFLLNKLGYNAGAPDGKMGPKTAAAIRKFEGRTRKAKTGKVTPVLLRRLEVLSG